MKRPELKYQDKILEILRTSGDLTVSQIAARIAGEDMKEWNKVHSEVWEMHRRRLVRKDSVNRFWIAKNYS